jgi:hypothetical protein
VSDAMNKTWGAALALLGDLNSVWAADRSSAPFPEALSWPLPRKETTFSWEEDVSLSLVTFSCA